MPCPPTFLLILFCIYLCCACVCIHTMCGHTCYGHGAALWSLKGWTQFFRLGGKHPCNNRINLINPHHCSWQHKERHFMGKQTSKMPNHQLTCPLHMGRILLRSFWMLLRMLIHLFWNHLPLFQTRSYQCRPTQCMRPLWLDYLPKVSLQPLETIHFCNLHKTELVHELRM